MAKKKQFAVIGLGRFGSSVACALAKSGHQVLAVDTNEERIKKVIDKCTHAVKADSTNEEALKELGMNNFDIVIVAIGQDIQASVLTTLILKEMGVSYIVAKADNLHHGKMLEKIGADRIVYPERDMGLRIAHNLLSTNVIDYIELAPNLGIVEIAAPKIAVNQTLADSNLRARFGVNVVAIKRAGQIIAAPLPNEIIREKDLLIVFGDDASIRGFEDLE